MRKILISLLTVGIVGATAFAATQAFFSDTETSTGNVLQAGAIDLLIDNTSYVIDYLTDEENPTGAIVASAATTWQQAKDLGSEDFFFNFSDLKPGDIGEDTISIHVNNNDAYACMAVNLTDKAEDGIVDPEAEAGDVTTEEGELQNYLQFAFWVDDGDNVFEEDETVAWSGLASDLFDGTWQTLADTGESPFDGPIPGDETVYLAKAWCFGDLSENPQTEGDQTPSERNATGFTCSGDGDQNDAQTDSITADISFYAVQARNNDGFLCSSLEPLGGGGEQGPFVGAALGNYAQPECNITVTSTEGTSIQDAVNGANAGQTVCVNPGTYNQNVIINKELTLAGDGASATSTINGFVQISADNVTVKGFEITGGDPGAGVDFSGIYILANTSGHTISDNLIDGGDAASTRGILFGYDVSNVLVTNNVIRDWHSGTYINPTTVGNLDLTYNDFESNAVGIGSDGITDVSVMNNEFDSNTAEAIGVGDFERVISSVLVNQNNFIPAGAGNNVNAYFTPLTEVVDATNNWWDSEAEGDRTNDTSEVDTEPAAGGLFPHN